MAFFKNLIDKMQKLFSGEEEDEREDDGVAKQRTVVSEYQAATHAQAPIREVQPEHQVVQQKTTEVREFKVATAPIIGAPKIINTVSDVVEYQVQSARLTKLDILVDALGLNRRKIVCERGVIGIPFDASGCDFDTKRQLTLALADEYQMSIELPNGMTCTEASKRIFSAIRAAREECLVCGSLFVAICQDIDSEGFMVAEVTNIYNGNSVFFDIPATISNQGTVEVDYDLINTNLMIAREKVSPKH